MNDLGDERNNLKFHSNAYAGVDSGLISRTDGMTFDKRLRMESERKFVNSYRRSNLGSNMGYQRAKSIEVEPRQQPAGAANRSQPTMRRYDPFHS